MFSTDGELIHWMSLVPPQDDAGFGVSVAVSGETMVVGAPGLDYKGATNAGKAYVFEPSGGELHLEPRLTIENPTDVGDRRPYGATWKDTSEYMIGNVLVSVVLLESDGRIDPSTEDWSDSQKSNVYREIQEGADWWQDMFWKRSGLGAGLDFLIDSTYLWSPIRTGYEPIIRSSEDDDLWQGDFLDRVGCSSVREWNDVQRRQWGCDWAYTVFVVDSTNDEDDKFTDDRFAYARLGGPRIVMTYDIDGWGIGKMEVVFAHETGHIFYALDEYPGSASYDDHSGYYNTQNQNAIDDNPDPSNRIKSIMAESELQKEAYDDHTSSGTSLQMIGWRDLDGDGLFDVVDVPLTPTGIGNYNPLTGNYEFSGHSSVQTYPNNNPRGWRWNPLTGKSKRHDITINTVDLLYYRVDGGAWVNGNYYGLANADVSQNVAVGPGTHTIEFQTMCVMPRVYSDIVSDTFNVIPKVMSVTASPTLLSDDDVGGDVHCEGGV